MQPTSRAAMSGGWPSRPENAGVVRAGAQRLHGRRFPPEQSAGLGLDGQGAAGPDQKKKGRMGVSEAETILCNSIAGLLGNVAIVKALPPDLPVYAVAVLLGAVIGTALGIRFAVPIVLKALGLVLVVAGLKLIGVY